MLITGDEWFMVNPHHILHVGQVPIFHHGLADGPGQVRCRPERRMEISVGCITNDSNDDLVGFSHMSHMTFSSTLFQAYVGILLIWLDELRWETCWWARSTMLPKAPGCPQVPLRLVKIPRLWGKVRIIKVYVIMCVCMSVFRNYKQQSGFGCVWTCGIPPVWFLKHVWT